MISILLSTLCILGRFVTLIQRTNGKNPCALFSCIGISLLVGIIFIFYGFGDESRYGFGVKLILFIFMGCTGGCCMMVLLWVKSIPSDEVEELEMV